MLYSCLGNNPRAILDLITKAVYEEMNSTASNLRNIFLSKIPTEEEILMACQCLSDKLVQDQASRNEVKIALLDILEEALQGKGDNLENLMSTKKKK